MKRSLFFLVLFFIFRVMAMAQVNSMGSGLPLGGNGTNLFGMGLAPSGPDFGNVLAQPQEAPPGWDYLITATNHTILIPGDVVVNIPVGSLAPGDFIGVFFDSLGTLKCGGYLQWNDQADVIAAWGVDLGEDGFQSGEEFVWKVYDVSLGYEYTATATYNSALPNLGNFSPNGMSGITALTVPVPDWNFVITSANHTILVPETVSVNMNGLPLEIGDFIGVFYDSLGVLKCGGYLMWQGQNDVVSAWGADNGINGFGLGEVFKWKVWRHSTGLSYDVQVQYDPAFPNSGAYQVNGISGIFSIQSVAPPWQYAITATNHIIYIPANALIQFAGTTIGFGDYIGVFYDSLGTLACAGYQLWNGQAGTIAAWGADVGGDGFVAGEAFTWKIWDASTLTEYIATASYDPSFPNQGTFSVNGMSGITQLIVNQPNWTYTLTGLNHTILVPVTAQLTIDGADLAPGDFLGVFFDSLGTPACGGYLVWMGQSTTLAAWGADNPHDGFALNEPFQWKIFRASDGEIFSANASYMPSPTMPDQGFFVANGLSGLLSLTASTIDSQLVSLAQGWNLKSTYIQHLDPAMPVVFSNIISQVSIVKSGSGGIFWPQFNVNSIGNWGVGRGYYVKMLSPQTLVLKGQILNPTLTPLPLSAGWSLLGYIRTTPTGIAAQLSSIVGSIQIVKNNSGAVYWPQFNVNSIVNLLPGEGYQVKMLQSATLTYAANSDPGQKCYDHDFISDSGSLIQPTGQNMTLGIPPELGGLTPGTLIRALSPSGMPVGAGRFEGISLALAIWGDDPFSPETDGLREGEPFCLELIQPTGESTLIQKPRMTGGANQFQTDRIAILQVQQAFVPRVEGLVLPARESLSFRITLPEEMSIEARLLDAAGKEVLVFNPGTLYSGENQVQIALPACPSGLYFLKLKGIDWEWMQKVPVVR